MQRRGSPTPGTLCLLKLPESCSKVGVEVVIAILLHKAGTAAKPYLKPPTGTVVVDMVTPEGTVVRVPIDAVPENVSAMTGEGKGGPRKAQGGGRRGGYGEEEGSETKERIRGQKQDLRQVRDIARKHGISDVRGFGDFLEAEKAAGNGGTLNDRGDFTFEELETMAELFKAEHQGE